MTNGWDLVAVASQGTLNALLSEAVTDGLLPATIVAPITLEGSTTTVTIELDTANPPTVDLNPTATPGQSAMVALTLAFSSGTLAPATGSPSTIPAGTLTITTEIAYVDVDFSGGTNETLALDFTSDLAVYNVEIVDTGLTPTQQDIIDLALEVYFQSLTPGSVPLGTVVVPAVAASLEPVGESEFAIQTATSPDDNALLLLMTTSTGVAPTGSAGVDFSDIAPLLQPGQPSALYISNRVLIEEIIVPGMCSSMHLPATDFSFSGSPTVAYTATFSGNVSLGGTDDPYLQGLSLSVNDDNQVQGGYDVAAHPLFNAGGTYYVKVTGDIFVSPTLDTSTQAISFATTSNTGSGTLECSPLGWAIIVAGIIATWGTLGAFIATVVAVVVPIVVALLQFPVNLGSVDASISDSLSAFVWPLQQNYPLSSVSVPGDLVIVGDPTL
jgi:hypothetical protein